MFPFNLHRFRGEKLLDIRKETGIWMKKNLPHPVRTMSRKPYIPYYADAIFFVTPPAFEDVINVAKANNIEYIIMDRDVDYILRPQLRFLFNPDTVPENLKLIFGYSHPKTGEILIGVYRIEA